MEVLRWGIPDSLPLGSHLIQGSHPFTGVCLQFHQGQSSGGRGSGSAEQGCLRAGSTSISRLLQPVIHGYESFRGVETGHRPFHSELEDSADILQDGDTSIRSSLGSSGGLDGASGLEGCVLAGANAPGFTQVPQVPGGGEGVPVQGTLLRPFHGSASFYQGHGTCVSDSTQDGGTTSSLPGRLVASGILTRAGSPCSEDSAPTLQAPRDCCQLGEVSGDSDSADGISGSHPGLTAFAASPALKRVEKLLSIGDVFLSCVSQPVSSGLELLGVLSSMFQLVPGGRLRSSLQACGLRKTSSSRSMPGSSWRSRVLSGGLLHFSPVPQWRSSPTNRQPCRICGTKAGLVLLSELRRSEDSPLGGGSVCGDFPTGYYGETQCASGRSFSPKPGLGLRVDAEAGGLQGFVQEVAGVSRPVCNVSKSQLFLIFFSLPQSQ